jgi:Protein of unknown function (DUF3039)
VAGGLPEQNRLNAADGILPARRKLGAVTDVLPAGGTRVDSDTRPDLSTGDGDHERFAHYVLKDKIMDSAVNGTPMVALCGKVWVPSRDPKRFPICPECKEIFESLPDGEG